MQRIVFHGINHFYNMKDQCVTHLKFQFANSTLDTSYLPCHFPNGNIVFFLSILFFFPLCRPRKVEGINGKSHKSDSVYLAGLTNDPQMKIVLFIFLLLTYFLSITGNLTIITLSMVDSHLKTPIYFFFFRIFPF